MAKNLSAGCTVRPEVGIEDRAGFSGHSCRVGAAQTAAAHGASVVALQRMRRWTIDRTPAAYIRRQSVKDSAAALIANNMAIKIQLAEGLL